MDKIKSSCVKKMRSDEVYVCLERKCCSQCVFMCLLHIGREHKRYWWTSFRVVVCLLAVDINVTGGED